MAGLSPEKVFNHAGIPTWGMQQTAQALRANGGMSWGREKGSQFTEQHDLLCISPHDECLHGFEKGSNQTDVQQGIKHCQ
ncbi:hypothetical protein Krac_1547 [Ktedonobacter racemifer DSM 44963]|uniref:Uncharacterized protein n=2 Tax=Ktedonobacter racemifer TaxID=363277 RepID=D6U228_KTERA|nr:hypothetical protein Krac_1547 [Ktedonobacter racemifer DSM 44963]